MCSIGHRSLVLAPLVAAAALAGSGCATSSYAESPPPGFSLAGDWTLDPQRSTDTTKVLQQLAKAPAQRDQGPLGNSPYGGGRRQGGRGSQGQGSQLPGSDSGLGLPEEARPQPYRPPIDMQQAELAGGSFLRIDQRPDEMIIQNGVTTRSFTPGVKSVVSVSSGVADQSSGWKGKDYLVEIKPQVGPRILERYRLSDDGKQLTQTINISSEGRVPAVSVTRVYTAGGTPPSAVPIGD